MKKWGKIRIVLTILLVLAWIHFIMNIVSGDQFRYYISFLVIVIISCMGIILERINMLEHELKKD